MRVLLAAAVALLLSVLPAQAGRARDGFGTSARCHCDRYLNPHYTERSRPVGGRGAYRGMAVYRRY